MRIEKKILTLQMWGEQILEQIKQHKNTKTGVFSDILRKAYYHNNWFTEDNVVMALQNICNEFLQKDKLEQWVQQYSPFTIRHSCVVGITMAGNIPLVGFQDLLCVLITDHKALIKLSSKDNILLPYLLNILFAIDPSLKSQIVISEMLKGADAYIATGSDNSARYFKQYFGKYPHIIRKNRTSIAILDGTETDQELKGLGKDVFSYFGMGCRNVGKLILTPQVELQKLMHSFDDYNYLNEHVKYKNNFDYQLTILLMNKTKCLANHCVILTETEFVHSPLSVLYYEVNNQPNEVIQRLNADEVQCIVGKNYTPFGTSQIPSLNDYADNVDTLKWLIEL